MAANHYADKLRFDDEMRNSDPHWVETGFPDEDYIAALRRAITGAASNDELMATVGWALAKFSGRGADEVGSAEWRTAARALAVAELEAESRRVERDEGDFTGKPSHPLLTEPAPSTELPRLTIRELFEDHRRALNAAGRVLDAKFRWKPVIESLIGFLGHNDAHRITRRDVARWRDQLLETLAPKTVQGVYLATVKATFNHAINTELAETNPVSGVKVIVSKPMRSRERGFNDEEAEAILKAAHVYRPASTREHASTTRAKRWLPLLAAYTGARIGELAQLRTEDVRQHNSFHVLRLTPDAGTIKTKQYRDVPLHPHLVELGFLRMVEEVKSGPMFFDVIERHGRKLPAAVIGDRVATWIHSLEVADKSVQPNHGWRHRFKTVGREVGIDGRVFDAIQGHAPRTAGDGYGNVTLKAKFDAIEKLPRYRLSCSQFDCGQRGS